MEDQGDGRDIIQVSKFMMCFTVLLFLWLFFYLVKGIVNWHSCCHTQNLDILLIVNPYRRNQMLFFLFVTGCFKSSEKRYSKFIIFTDEHYLWNTGARRGISDQKSAKIQPENLYVLEALFNLKICSNKLIQILTSIIASTSIFE